MEMQQVRYFLAVAHCRNFTRAAEECNVTQPSLTRAIKQLEAELGGDLFRRERPQALVTELGQRMLPLLKQCYESAIGAKALASSIKSGDVGSLQLALSHTIDLALLAPHMGELRKVFRSLELKLIRGAGSEIVEVLKRGEAELAVAAGMDEEWERLDRWPLFEESFHLVASRNHRLANQASVDLKDLRGELLFMRPYCEGGQHLLDELGRHDFDVDRSDAAGSEADLMALLAAEIGIGIVPGSTSVPDTLVRTTLRGLDLRRTVYLYAVAGRERTAVASAMMKKLRAADWSAVIG